MSLVLIVDDQQAIALALEMLVRSLGHATAVVRDGRAALAFLRARPVDLVLLDVMMPGMSGLDVLRAMGADRATPWPPVVVLSGNTEFRSEALTLGAVEFVVKTEPDRIGDAITQHLEATDAGNSGGRHPE